MHARVGLGGIKLAVVLQVFQHLTHSTEAGGDMLLDITNSTHNAFDDQLTSHLNG